jgi:amino-acid N-acetyltransferase
VLRRGQRAPGDATGRLTALQAGGFGLASGGLLAHYQNVITRRAIPSDAASISALIDLYVPTGTLLPRSEEFIATYAHEFIVVEGTGGIAGCVHLDEYSPSLAELRSLAVAPASQHVGIGRALVSATESFARARGYSTLFAVSNDIAFFERFGFERRNIPELDLERSEVSRYKGVLAKDLLDSADAA